MELLLLLTAIFASLTGGASGTADRAAAPGVAVVRAAQAAQAAVQPARVALPRPAIPAAIRPERAALPLHVFAALTALRLPFERRLE